MRFLFVICLFVGLSCSRSPSFNNAESAFHGNVELARSQQWQKAVDAYREAIRLKPRYASAFDNLGVAYNQLGQFADAAKAFQQAIQLEPNWAKPHYDLGVAFSEQNKKQEALTAYLTASRLDPPHLFLFASVAALGVLIAVSRMSAPSELCSTCP